MKTSVTTRDFKYTIDNIMLKGATGKASLTQWCDRARSVRAALQVLLDESKKEYAEAQGKYNQKTLAETRDRLQAEDTVAIDIAKSTLSNALEEVLDEKMAAFSRAMAAPSQDAVNLLTVLNMREHLTSSEIAAAVPALNKSLSGLALLSEIASRHDILFPRLTTDFFSVADETRQAAKMYIDAIAKDEAEMSYKEIAFYGPHGSNKIFQPYIDAVDRPSFLTVDTEEIKPKLNDEMIREGIAEGVKQAFENMGGGTDATP